MHVRPLGDSGLSVSVLGLGCNAFGSRIDETQARSVVEAALEAGITFFDTADTYGLGASEVILGRALGSRRDDVVVATKGGMDMQGRNGPDWGARASRRYLTRALDASLERLGTDHVDLYQLHTPDRVTPIDETLAFLDNAVRAGKIRYAGCSNLRSWELVDAVWTARSAGTTSFVSAQNEYSLYNRTAEDDLVPACEHLGVGLIPYFPLAYGLLTGKYRRGEAAPEGSRLADGAQAARLAAADWDRIEALGTFADERGLTMLDVAIGGLVAKPAVSSVIAGATRPEQIAANAAAAQWIPSEEDRVALDALADPAGHSYSTFAPRR
ncbi:aryl-alcohol dehydrogenase-like predicted oxidoreductase [Mumia flava]|uniref:Aryl-alcohol dehydrogenase-like predicted oxidoreductase n=2 Tax=Mumia flava TaxID=1348852 RepID=A0A2M9BKC6_9ACTN|nr:aryl-alcohol dehydrogenase-like predicted oxidoreductase [Mumia flava]